jgi:hypothetical protein
MPQRLLSTIILIDKRPGAQRMRNEKWLRKNSKPFSRERFRFVCETKAMIQETRSAKSKTEVRNVAVANRDLRVDHQQAVDAGQQSAEQGDGGRKGDNCGLGHCELSGFAGGDGHPAVSRSI